MIQVIQDTFGTTWGRVKDRMLIFGCTFLLIKGKKTCRPGIVRWCPVLLSARHLAAVIMMNVSTFQGLVNHSAYGLPPLWRSLLRFASWEAWLSGLRFLMRDEILRNGFHSTEVIDLALRNWDGGLAFTAKAERPVVSSVVFERYVIVSLH